MKKKLALTVVLLLLCACSAPPQNPRARTVTTVPGFADTALPRQIVFAIDENAGDILVSAAESFCRKANSLSDGIFTLTLSKSADPLSELKSGNAGFIFLDGVGAEEIHPCFSITNERFSYSSYEDFSLKLNSRHVLRFLSGVSGVDVFAAYYTGSNVFAGNAPLDDTLREERGGDGAETSRKATVLTIPDSGTEAAFHDLPWVMAADALDPSERFDTLFESGKTAEFSFSELVSNLTGTSVPGLAGSENAQSQEEEETQIVVTRSFHSTTPMWLILAPSLYDGLVPLGRAALDEAAAYLTDNIDGAYLRLEREHLDTLIENDIAVSGGFTSTRAKILRARSASAAGLSDDEKRLRDLLDKF